MENLIKLMKFCLLILAVFMFGYAAFTFFAGGKLSQIMFYVAMGLLATCYLIFREERPILLLFIAVFLIGFIFLLMYGTSNGSITY